MIEIIWRSNADYLTYKMNHREFKCPFVDIANGQLRWIQGYNIDNARDRQICNKVQFEDIANSHNCT